MSSDPVDPLRQERPVFGLRRARIAARCAELDAELRSIDAELNAAQQRRRTVADELHSLQERLRVRLGRPGRLPAPDGAEQLPPVPADVTWLRGRRLRAACVAILARLRGEVRLVELHGLLHRHGFAVEHHHAVKALADALGYEADGGRVRRVRRGVYQARPGVAPITGPLWRGGPTLGDPRPLAA